MKYWMLVVFSFCVYSCGGSDGKRSDSSSGESFIILNAPPNCTDTTIHCVGAGQEYDTDILSDEDAIQQAVDAAQPGDQVRVAAGNYGARPDGTQDIFIEFQNSGTPGNPIRMAPFDNEQVSFEGRGFPEGTTGPSDPGEILFNITGSHIIFENFELFNATRDAVRIGGSFVIARNLYIHDNWEHNIFVLADTVDIEGVVLDSIESSYSRHKSGISFGQSSANPARIIDSVVKNSLAYFNGYQPDGQRVPPVPGDPDGGGNSDGIGSSKDCQDKAAQLGVANACPGMRFINNIVWHNADDGMDISSGLGSVVEGNIVFDNRKQGFKGFREVQGGILWSNNISYANGFLEPGSGIGRGFEIRCNGDCNVYNNSSIGNADHGITLGNTAGNVGNLIGFLSWGNGGIDIVNDPADPFTLSDNHISSNGDPLLVDDSFSPDTNLVGATIQERYSNLKSQFANLAPDTGSPVIDARTFLIVGYDCDTADDDPVNPEDPNSDCRHFVSTQPDIGALEFGLGEPIDPPVQMANVEVSWTLNLTREDGSIMDASELDRHDVEYDCGSGLTTIEVPMPDTSVVFSAPVGAFCTISGFAVDTDGLASSGITITNLEVVLPTFPPNNPNDFTALVF